ncbi:MAG TPA: hypothetical protein VGF24_09470 [Vicinamibacterales bacterium]|jgi:hypothetical protein
MSARCSREADVVASVFAQHGCGQLSEELSAHIESCDVCAEVATVTRLLSVDHERDRREIRVPAAGQVWWRAAVRARLEAVHAAARPLTWSHGVAGACAVGLVVALFGLSWGFIREAVDALAIYVLSTVPFGEAGAFVSRMLQPSVAMMLLVGACVVCAPFLIYVALSDE